MAKDHLKYVVIGAGGTGAASALELMQKRADLPGVIVLDHSKLRAVDEVKQDLMRYTDLINSVGLSVDELADYLHKTRAKFEPPTMADHNEQFERLSKAFKELEDSSKANVYELSAIKDADACAMLHAKKLHPKHEKRNKYRNKYHK